MGEDLARLDNRYGFLEKAKEEEEGPFLNGEKQYLVGLEKTGSE